MKITNLAIEVAYFRNMTNVTDMTGMNGTTEYAYFR